MINFFSFLFLLLVFGNVLAFKSGVLDVANSVMCFFFFFFSSFLSNQRVFHLFSICHAPVDQP